MLSYELREQVLDYINNHIDLESLEDWYVPRLRQFLKDPDSADAEIVAAIELAVTHLAGGVQDEDEIKDILWDVLSKHSPVMHLDITNPAPHSLASELRITTRASSGSDGQPARASFPFKHIAVSYQP
jgi:hypothetical protein